MVHGWQGRQTREMIERAIERDPEITAMQLMLRFGETWKGQIYAIRRATLRRLRDGGKSSLRNRSDTRKRKGEV